MGLLFERAATVRRPLSRAMASLGGSHSGRGRRGAEFLAELLDFKGAIELSRALSVRPTALAAPPASASRLACDGLATARSLLERAEREARRPLDGRQGAGALLSAARIDAMLQKVLVRPVRRNAVAAAARELFVPLETRVRERVAVVRRTAREAREEIGLVVAASGASAARLERLDAALHAATAVRVDGLFVRAAAALGDAFAADVERAVVDLPRPPVGAPLAPWAGATTLAADHVARCESLVLAIFQHERMRLDTLVSSALGEGAT